WAKIAHWTRSNLKCSVANFLTKHWKFRRTQNATNRCATPPFITCTARQCFFALARDGIHPLRAVLLRLSARPRAAALHESPENLSAFGGRADMPIAMRNVRLTQSGQNSRPQSLTPEPLSAML